MKNSIILLLATSLFGEENIYGGSFSFNNISPSAQSLSLGNTITSTISMPSSLDQNPAIIWSSSTINIIQIFLVNFVL